MILASAMGSLREAEVLLPLQPRLVAAAGQNPVVLGSQEALGVQRHPRSSVVVNLEGK